MVRYVAPHIAKVKTMGHVAGLGLNVEREREIRNADEASRQEQDLNGRYPSEVDFGRLVRESTTNR